jgi:hypothetical protein
VKSCVLTRCSVSYCLIILLQATVAQAQRAIPPDNLAYPVLIVLDTGQSASGFYLSTEKHVYFVTGKHVLFEFNKGQKKWILIGKRARCLSYPEDPNDSGHILLEFNLEALLAKGSVKYHIRSDAAIVEIGQIVRKTDNDKKMDIRFVDDVRKSEGTSNSPIVCAHISGTKRLADTLIANDVFIFGYPSSIGIKEMPQIDPNRPLLRKGIIAGKGIGGGTLVIDCPSYYGNSGGPVLEVDQVSFVQRKYLVIGLISEFVPFKETWLNVTHKLSHWEITNSGYSVVTPIDAVLELLPDDERMPVKEQAQVTGQLPIQKDPNNR